MAIRPVFVSSPGNPAFREFEVRFSWHAGFARSQKEKNIRELHNAFEREYPDSPVLEVSGKSLSPLGIALSAFNLHTSHTKYGSMTVESAFQGSKVFADLGQIEQAYDSDPRTAKSIAREADSQHDLLRFSWEMTDWPLEPKTLFYDWLYCSGLREHPGLLSQLRAYRAFTDIEFNPEKSFNCQARSCAIAVSLSERGLLEEALNDRQRFMALVYSERGSDDGHLQQLTFV